MIERIFNWFESRTEVFPAAQPEKPGNSLWSFIWYYSRPFRPLLFAAAIVGCLVALLEVSLFAFMGRLVDWLSAADRQGFWADHGLRLTLIGILVAIILPILKFLYDAIIHQGMMGNYAMRIRWQAHRYVLRQSMDFFQNDFAGRVATKVMQTALAVRDTVLKLIETALYIGVYFTGALVLLAASDWRLISPLIVWLVGYLACMWYFIPRLGKLSEAQADARSVVTGRIVDAYTNIPTVKLFASAGREDHYAKEGMEHMLGTVYQSMRMVTSLTGVLSFLNGFLIFSTAATSIWLWNIGAVSTGAIAFAIGLVLRMQGMSQWVIWEMAGLFENIGVVRDGIETIARDRDVIDRPHAKPLKVTRGEIRYDKITFNYGRDISHGEKGIIEDLSLTIKPGEKVGIVGRSGAGKSTLTSLLLRFYDLESGTISIDGQNVAEVKQDSLRAAIGMVTQDTSLLHRSVRDNIRYGKPDATEDDIVAAARKAHADEFIRELQDLEGRRGYDAHVGERGVKLSGGQRQRIAIARVLLKNAPILVLDEATSALDSEVEAAIQENLYALMEGKTVIAVAHRLSTIAAMDRLIVMDRGRIIEEGAHDILLRKGGIYAQLWQRQSGGFLAYEEAAE